MMMATGDDQPLGRLAGLLAQRLGLHFPPARHLELRDRMQRAAHEFGFVELDDCLSWLLSTPLEQPRLDVLASHLTRGETGFFRDRAAFAVLEREVLPQLICERRDSGRRLRCWSAACSTGEEPYSLAIALRGLLPEPADWQVRILGSDVNPHFLQRARSGLFDDAAFADAPAGLRQRWFRRTSDGRWALRAEIRRMVEFGHINLGADSYPALSNHTGAIDLLLCRQVLSEFSPAQATRALGKLARCLSEDGWLLLGPGDLERCEVPELVPLTIDGVTLLRRRRLTAIRRLPAEPPLRAARRPGLASFGPQPALPDADPFERALRCYHEGDYAAAERLLQEPDTPPACRLLARVLAVQGRLDEALAACARAIEAAPDDPANACLRAGVLQEQGALGEAMQAYQRALYLDPGCLLGHYGLGNLARRLGRLGEAERHYANAQALAARLPPEAVLDEVDGLSAGRLLEIVIALQRVEQAAD